MISLIVVWLDENHAPLAKLVRFITEVPEHRWSTRVASLGHFALRFKTNFRVLSYCAL